MVSHQPGKTSLTFALGKQVCHCSLGHSGLDTGYPAQELALQCWQFPQLHLSQSWFLYSSFSHTPAYMYIPPPSEWMHKHRHIHCSCVTFALIYLGQDCQVILHVDLNFVFSLTNPTLGTFTHLVRESLKYMS